MTDHYIKAYFDNCADALKLKTKFEASNVTQRGLFIKDVFKIYLGRIFFFSSFFFEREGGGESILPLQNFFLNIFDLYQSFVGLLSIRFFAATGISSQAYVSWDNSSHFGTYIV